MVPFQGDRGRGEIVRSRLVPPSNSGASATTARSRGTDLKLRVYTWMAGPRIASHAISAVTPFAQVLFGGSHMSGGTQFGGALTGGITYQPGVGVDLNVMPRAGIRLQGDYRKIRTQGHDSKESRFLVGVVLRSGQ